MNLLILYQKPIRVINYLVTQRNVGGKICYLIGQIDFSHEKETRHCEELSGRLSINSCDGMTNRYWPPSFKKKFCGLFTHCFSCNN